MVLTVDNALKRYWKEHVAVKVVDKVRVDYAIKAMQEYFSDTNMVDVDVPFCRGYLSHRMAEGVSEGTVRRELGTLQAAANHCLKWRHIRHDEMPSIELPPGAPPKVTWLYKDELQALAGAATGRALWFILLAYYTAGRKTSIETLERYQVDLDAKRINLSKRGEVKTKKRRPIVPIDKAIYDRLVDMLNGHSGKFVLEDDGDIRREFDKAAAAAGLENLPERGMRETGRLSPHVLRHSRATHLLQDGVSPYAVAALLGDNLQTVLRVYGHNCPDFLAEAIA